MKFHPIDIKAADWKRLDQFADRTVFQTREWLQFVAESQNALPVLAELREKNDVLGYFSGLIFSKFGMKVLGSSFPGWTTPYIGFNLNPGVPRRAAIEALEKFAWDDLKCLHLEVSDPNFTFQDGEAAGFNTEYFASYRTDLSRSEEDLFNSMESACRRCIRKADKSGLKIEEAHGRFLSVLDYAPGSPGAKAYTALVSEILDHGRAQDRTGPVALKPVATDQPDAA